LRGRQLWSERLPDPHPVARIDEPLQDLARDTEAEIALGPRPHDAGEPCPKLTEDRLTPRAAAARRKFRGSAIAGAWINAISGMRVPSKEEIGAFSSLFARRRILVSRDHLTG
jgi:hypothetical protein